MTRLPVKRLISDTNWPGKDLGIFGAGFYSYKRRPYILRGTRKKLLCSRGNYQKRFALCDSYYIDACNRNEIISGEKLSSIATRARRN